MNKVQVQIENRIATLEAHYVEIKDDIKELKENDIAHLSTGLKELHDKFDKAILAVLATLIGVLIDIGLKFL